MESECMYNFVFLRIPICVWSVIYIYIVLVQFVNVKSLHFALELLDFRYWNLRTSVKTFPGWSRPSLPRRRSWGFVTRGRLKPPRKFLHVFSRAEHRQRDVHKSVLHVQSCFLLIGSSVVVFTVFVVFIVSLHCNFQGVIITPLVGLI